MSVYAGPGTVDLQKTWDAGVGGRSTLRRQMVSVEPWNIGTERERTAALCSGRMMLTRTAKMHSRIGRSEGHRTKGRVSNCRCRWRFVGGDVVRPCEPSSCSARRVPRRPRGAVHLVPATHGMGRTRRNCACHLELTSIASDRIGLGCRGVLSFLCPFYYSFPPPWVMTRPQAGP